MKKTSLIALALGLTLPAAVLAQSTVGDVVGTSEQEVRATLSSLGYTVDEVEIESDEIEAEVTRAGERFEIEISPDTGRIVEIESDNDDDGRDDDDGDSDDRDNDDDRDDD